MQAQKIGLPALTRLVVLGALVVGGCTATENLDGEEPCERCDEAGEVALASKPVRLTDQPLGECWTEGNLAVCQDELLHGFAAFGLRVGTGAELVNMNLDFAGRYEAYLADADNIETIEFVGWGRSPTDTNRGILQYQTVNVDYRPGDAPVTLPGPDFFVIGLVSKHWQQLQLEIVYTLDGEEITESERTFWLEPETVLNSNRKLNVHRSYLPIDPGSSVEIDEANGGICWGIDLDEADWIVVDGCPSVLEPGELESMLD